MKLKESFIKTQIIQHFKLSIISWKTRFLFIAVRKEGEQKIL